MLKMTVSKKVNDEDVRQMAELKRQNKTKNF